MQEEMKLRTLSGEMYHRKIPSKIALEAWNPFLSNYTIETFIPRF
jgi:hypothetical protein